MSLADTVKDLLRHGTRPLLLSSLFSSPRPHRRRRLRLP